MSFSTTLTSLFLSDNSFGDGGGTFLAESLRKNTSITRLKMNNCGIDLEGFTALAEAVDVNKTLLCLKLVARYSRDILKVVRSLTVWKIMAELRARGLCAEGLREVLILRLQNVLDHTTDRYTSPIASIKKSLARNTRFVLENKLIAFAMGMHQRLGSNDKGAVRKLEEADILRAIANQLCNE